MSYREKRAWLMLAAMAVTFGPYFAIASRTNIVGLPNLHQLALFATTVLVQVVLLIAGHIVLAIREPKDTRMPPDERDRAIERRSLGLAYYALIWGFFLVGCVMPFTSQGWAIVNAALFMIVLAEIVHYGVVVWSYRRQAA